MDTAAIIGELEAERDRLSQAIAALRGSRNIHMAASGRPNGRKRRMSAEVKRKLSLAAKARWAKAKKAGKNAL
jgi:hypothetical protein